VRGWTANITAAAAELLVGVAGTYSGCLMQALDVVDWFLLAGALVYFGLWVLRRI
jgi:hypothetical protein